MEVDDKKCQLAMIKMIKAIEELQPNIEGVWNMTLIYKKLQF